MATPSRSALIARTLRVLKKHFKPVFPPKDRSLFEHLAFASLLEDSPHETAEQVFETFRRDYFDWNEVRVSTIRELSEVTKPLVDHEAAAARLKQTLHSVFESVYQFDLESLKKQNIGQAAKRLQKLGGTTPFMVAYATQTGLGGHAMPVNRGLLVAFHVIGVISDAEAGQGAVPGLERAISKRKGIEAASLLHQLGVEVGRNPYGQAARKLLLEIAPDSKDRLPKRQTRRAAAEAPTAEAVPAESGEAPPAAEAATESPEPVAGRVAGRKPTKKKTPPTKRPAATKKASQPRKKPPAKAKKKHTGRRLTKRKPR
jgi:endonuclease III